MNTTVRRLIPVLLAALFLERLCGTHAAEAPRSGAENPRAGGMPAPFLPAKYRLVHALETVMPDGKRGTAIGVLVADPRTRSFQTALMTTRRAGPVRQRKAGRR